MREAGAGTRGYMSAGKRQARNANTARQAAENTEQFKANKKRANKLEKRLRKLEQGQAKAASAPKPKPKPNSGPQQIAPVTQSPEAKQAKDYTQAYEKKDYSSIFKQNDTDFTSNFNPGGNSSSAQKDPQEFADKYKLNLINSGATKQTDTTADKPMTGADILKKDKEQYGSYM